LPHEYGGNNADRLNIVIMIKFLAFIFFIFFILISLLGFSVFRLFKSFFSPDVRSRERQRSSSRNSRQQRAGSTQKKKHAKVIRKDEGEYVDYEEVR
jgi:predicted lipid-binding transport protein (Tim44 family)